MLIKNVLVFEVNVNQELLYPNPFNGSNIFNGTELYLLGCFGGLHLWNFAGGFPGVASPTNWSSFRSYEKFL